MTSGNKDLSYKHPNANPRHFLQSECATGTQNTIVDATSQERYRSGCS